MLNIGSEDLIGSIFYYECLILEYPLAFIYSAYEVRDYYNKEKGVLYSMVYSKTKEVLNQLVADLYTMRVIVHQTHWYMRDQGFLYYHPLLDEFIDDIDDQVDEIAERLVTLDGKPYSTLQNFHEHTQLEEIEGTFDYTIKEQLTRLVENYKKIADTLEKGAQISDKEGDLVSQDILLDTKGAVDKRIWMIQGDLGSAPGLEH